MKILVPIKRVADPENANKVKVTEDARHFRTDGLEWKMNPYDEYALEAALRLNENGATKAVLGETIVVTIGPADAAQTLRQAMAMGAERGILIAGDDHELDTNTVAELLAAVAKKEQPDVILMGKIAADTDSNAVGQYLAEKLSWPMATMAMRLRTDDGGKTFVVQREVDTGIVTLKVTAPLVITASDRLLHPEAVHNGVTPAEFAYPASEGGRYASLKGIMAAKKKSLEELTPQSFGLSSSNQIRYTAFSTPSKRTGAATFVSSVDELLSKLQTEAKALP